MREVDLDLLAAQAESEQEPVTVTFKGRKFTFPAEMPIGITIVSVELAMQTGRMAMVLRGMELAFNAGEAGQWEEFLELAPTREDLYRLWGALLDAYAVTEGESSSSAESSAAAGESSKPSSKGSTTSTRGRSSRAAAPAGS